MAKLFFFFLEILSLSFALPILFVNAQNQADFISIDCGAPENYTDKITGINYTSDSGYTVAGESKNASLLLSTQDIPRRYQNVRSFPEGRRNCYRLAPLAGKNHRYLIRASFMYGNYDGLSRLPQFDLHLGANKWKTVIIEDTSKVNTVEIIHVLQSDYIDVCLVKTNSYVPFISVLEMRTLGNDTYVAQSGSLEPFARLDCGLKPGQTVRFSEDGLDRLWTPFNFDAWDIINTTFPVGTNAYELPSTVMRTAVIPKNESSLIGFKVTASGSDGEIPEFYIYLHFSEVNELGINQTRQFNIYLNNNLWYGPFSPAYLDSSTIYSPSAIRGSNLQVLINRTQNSTLPPLLNAFEIYSVKRFPLSETAQNDVDAIENVMSAYKITRNWQGDPCAPSDYKWEGLNCSYNGSDPPRIVSLNLSSSGLSGLIDPHISSLTLLETLDLSHNNLSGNVPDFLSQMSSLKFLCLEGNNFSGTLPPALLEKSKNGSILLRVGENLHLSSPTISKNKDKKITVIALASVGGFLLLLLTVGSIFWWLRRRKQADSTAVNVSFTSNQQDGAELELKKQRFSYSEVLSITNNFERILGKGGFGTVYHGYFGNGHVAVKMLARSSAQGYKRFNAEAKLLIGVHHENLAAIIGYCDEGPNMGLVYEYMSNGDLARHLSDKNENTLKWEERLKIAIDAAQGLEYLHSGCKPQIIHRDVKSTNILLNEKLQAKLSDFGLSRVFSLEDDTRASSTNAVGTPGYVDPEYFSTNKLTEKSDVFSFGVVLLEIITGRPAISNINGKDHVIKWVDVRLTGEADVKDVSDPRLKQDFNTDSALKAVEVAMACVDPKSTRRPTMTQVVLELKQCLAMELARNKISSSATGSTEFIEMIAINPQPGMWAR